VLELKGGSDNTAMLTSKRGDLLFSVPVGEVRCRRTLPRADSRRRSIVDVRLYCERMEQA
jgi:hypothetical protein